MYVRLKLCRALYCEFIKTRFPPSQKLGGIGCESQKSRDLKIYNSNSVYFELIEQSFNLWILHSVPI